MIYCTVNYTFLKLNIKIILNLKSNYLILLINKNIKREQAETKIIEAPDAISYS